MKRYVTLLIYMMTFGTFISCGTNKTNDSNAENKYKIERIEYFTSACFGTCPQFKIEIEKDRKAVYTAVRFNFSQDFDSQSPEGIFTGKINEQDYNLILKKLNDMDFPVLQDRYKVDYTDAQTGNLKITYNGGQVKSITDYGMRGTPELQEVYELFLELRESQDWVNK
ncbi:DUF6438 domain-containing protein [Moheibacter sediminis]|uniref:DUF6438 domain-containing protein n=1 Tax=Moheibacter sediminis TaxID=1434700 RepID=A0A1W1Z033_9FLAO|nr:DUF6438 domain-containing protein [Moheibacter sediminis]SMC41799.1 hypothetical protein SAMN06296427_10268 [Moheibacter sediminis]